MKKIMLICALVVVSMSSVNAMGVGVVFGGNSGGWNFSGFNGGVGLSLGFGTIDDVKWELAVRMAFRSQRDNYSYFNISADADWHLLAWTPINWFQLYLAVGPYAGLGFYSYKTSSPSNGANVYFDFGGRLPLGARFMIADLVDIWLAFVPSVGFKIGMGNNGSFGLGGGMGGEIGVRFWF
jgi:hypothetical protein